jgi:hypothetical protein
MMTVARRNRVWTPELRNKLVNDVNKMTKRGVKRTVAFKELSPVWGAAHQTIACNFYKGLKRPVATSLTVPKAQTVKSSPDVLAAINVLKKMGVSVTLSF